jgi:hypothetical protein
MRDSNIEQRIFIGESENVDRMSVELQRLLLIAGLSLALFSMGVLIGCGSGTSDPPPPTLDEEGILYNVAGIAGESGNDGDGGPATSAHLSFPQDVTVSSAGDLYIIDAKNHCVRVVRTDGTIARYMGTGIPGDGDNGPASGAALNEPAGLTIGPLGDFWLASWKNEKVKWIDPVTTDVTAPVGTTEGFSGDNGPANAAQLNLPSSVVFDLDGNMYISDQANQRIRKVDWQMNIITFCGSGQKGFADLSGSHAMFSWPSGPNAVPGGRIGWGHHPYGLLVADTENHRIRYVGLDTADVYTIGGNGQAGYSGDGGSAKDAKLNYPTDVYETDDHEILIADSRNHVIRKISAIGFIETVVGSGVAGNSPDGTVATSAKLNTPSGIAFVESTRTLYIADTYNHQIKKVKLKR